MARIPRIFHFVFGLREQTEPFHLMYYLCLASCIEVNRPDAVCFHCHHEPHGPWWELIKPRLELRPIDPVQFVADYAYDDPEVARFRYAHMADFIRLEILLREGGVYADIDTLFLAPMPAQWFERRCILGHETPPAAAKGEGSLCNALIAAEPDAAFCRHWLTEMTDAFDGSWSNHSTLLPYRLARRFPDLLDVEPKTAFFSLDWTRKGLADLFLRDTALPGDAYSLHLWSHLWFDARRLDFCHFSADALTVDYVAFAPTTYARHARRFLPSSCRPSRWRYRAAAAALAARHPYASLRDRLARS